ncbi:hypothetical protein HanXRQr2_Chr09g0403681 [Helianthus annuus]|uniref:Uncharacterized protein n=1 Tax=Helianthus annuus TaxID=4232 RepID=A0A251TY17_HELAN|nr:hypothetical protein HanXRQr2_Chr09g0403681 [Helianthus annuus]KAJ0894487.1 hypothetical protein HanPSC8_Chr09g0389581 [Helianthus annuus]
MKLSFFYYFNHLTTINTQPTQTHYTQSPPTKDQCYFTLHPLPPTVRVLATGITGDCRRGSPTTPAPPHLHSHPFASPVTGRAEDQGERSKVMMMQGGGSVRVQSRVSLSRPGSGSVSVQSRVCLAIRGVSGQLSYHGQQVSWTSSGFRGLV